MHASDADWRANRIHSYSENADGTPMSSNAQAMFASDTNMTARDMLHDPNFYPGRNPEFRIQAACHEAHADPNDVADMDGRARPELLQYRDRDATFAPGQ